MAMEKKTVPGLGAEESLRECSRQVYENWKAGLAAKGKTPTEVVEHYRSIGMMDYADTLAEVIDKMEDRI